MVGVAVLAIAAAFAGPQFAQWGRSTRVTTHATDLQNALTYARSESWRRGVRVSICHSPAPRAATPACATSGSWADGWLIFVDNVQVSGNAAGSLDGTDVLLRIGDVAKGSTISVKGNLGDWLAYTPQGLVRVANGAANGSLLVCQAPYGRRVSVSAAGAPTVADETCK